MFALSSDGSDPGCEDLGDVAEEGEGIDEEAAGLEEFDAVGHVVYPLSQNCRIKRVDASPVLEQNKRDALPFTKQL